MMKYFTFIFALLISSCSLSKNSDSISSKKIFANEKSTFNLKDNAGNFIVKREKGLITNKNQFVVKQMVLDSSGNEKEPLEKNITISNLGRVKDIYVLRPYKSQYTVWFGGKEYSNDIQLDLQKKKLVVELSSPEKEWSGTREFDLPNPKSVYCFYSQVMECAAVTGFVEKAKANGQGKMNFYVIWNGYPYFHDQYVNLSGNLISRAQLEFDPSKKDNEIKFSLNVDNQVIFYVLDKNFNFIKQFWVAQGLSMLKN